MAGLGFELATAGFKSDYKSDVQTTVLSGSRSASLTNIPFPLGSHSIRYIVKDTVSSNRVRLVHTAPHPNCTHVTNSNE